MILGGHATVATANEDGLILNAAVAAQKSPLLIPGPLNLKDVFVAVTVNTEGVSYAYGEG